MMFSDGQRNIYLIVCVRFAKLNVKSQKLFQTGWRKSTRRFSSLSGISRLSGTRSSLRLKILSRRGSWLYSSPDKSLYNLLTYRDRWSHAPEMNLLLQFSTGSLLTYSRITTTQRKTTCDEDDLNARESIKLWLCSSPFRPQLTNFRRFRNEF